jgi:uncharacterized protein YbjT (DUF2867 family)
MILVTGATGMFGGGIARGLLEAGQPVRALVRDPAKASELESDGAELAVADMDKPETLPAALEGVERVFLVSPMDDRIAARETAVTAAAKDAGVDFVMKLGGAVKHRGDALAKLHGASIEALRTSGMRWALLSPNSVMETSLLSWAQPIKQTGAIFGSAGDGKVGLIAADDATASGVAVLAGEPESERNYEVTGPEALTSADMAAALSKALGKTITYNDMSDDDLRDLLVKYAGMTPEQADISVILHYQAWRRGDADLVTNTVEELTGRKPMSIDEWLPGHIDAFR